jgi:hypothetical protein
MDKLPTFPKLKPGIRYDEIQLYEKVAKVNSTSPEQYIAKIKELLAEILDYKECLEYKKFDLCGIDLDKLNPENVFAKKELIIR